jgi:hypothetical protein
MRQGFRDGERIQVVEDIQTENGWETWSFEGEFIQGDEGVGMNSGWLLIWALNTEGTNAVRLTGDAFEELRGSEARSQAEQACADEAEAQWQAGWDAAHEGEEEDF